jgi:hypothetical protein
MMAATLNLRLSADLQQQWRRELAAENNLRLAEQKITMADPSFVFVPDHLEYGCQAGVRIFKVTTNSFVSYWVVR